MNVISLDSIFGLGEMKSQPAPEASGCTTSSCGSSDGPSDMAPEVWEKVKNHPCYSEEAHHYYARMHVAVAPACNIQCNYCNRKYDCANESRPGVVSEKLTAEQAVRKVLAVAAEIPQLSVVGIAGPGDSLAAGAKQTIQTFEQLSQLAPDIKLCLSTNGLALPDYVDRLKGLNIDHVTITINMVDPEVGQHIYPWIFHDHKRWTGIEASRILQIAPVLGVRETRHIQGDYVLTGPDVLGGTHFADSIAADTSALDIHEPRGGDVDFRGLDAYEIPYRTLVPKGVEQLLVAGRCISADHDAHARSRNMPACMATGQAAGVAAAVAIDEGTSVRDVPIDKVQKILRDSGVPIHAAELAGAA